MTDKPGITAIPTHLPLCNCDRCHPPEAKTETWREVFGARVWVNDRGDLRVHAEINPPPIKPKPAPPKEDPTP